MWAAGVIMAFVGVFWMWSFNSAMSALQLLVDDSLRGRVMAVCNMISLGLIDQTWPKKYQEPLRSRLIDLLNDPDG